MAALIAFFLWGVLPVFWKQLGFLAPASIVAQRTLWSLALVVPLVMWSGERAKFVDAWRSPRALGWHALSGLLLASNWLLYVWATLNGRILEGALGYYLNPFFNMAFGTLWFGERHNRLQRVAIVIALAGVGVRLISGHGVPWVALALALSFALYAVVRKVAPLGSLSGLALETTLLAPVALGWLLLTSNSLPAAFGNSWPHASWIVASGVVTALPLLCFAYAARNLRLTTLGILQFLGPTLQFLIGWRFYGEPLTAMVAASFALIWLAVAIYACDAMRKGELSAAQ